MLNINGRQDIGRDRFERSGRTRINQGPDPSEDLFRTLAEDHGLALYRLALSKSHNAADAWDLVQETFARALRKRPSIDSRKELRAWLTRVMTNLFIDRCRASEQKIAAIDLDTLPAPQDDGAEQSWRTVSIDRVEALMPQLNATLRNVFTRHLAGRSIPAIASELEISVQQVSARLFRARKRLRALLLEEAPARDIAAAAG
jgi:RNA polymerase sigma-70 factor (ECF subfamily)